MLREKISAYYLLKLCSVIVVSAAIMYSGIILADDDNSHFTNVGNIGITVTDIGTLGAGFGGLRIDGSIC